MSELLQSLTWSSWLAGVASLTLATAAVLAVVLAADLVLARRVSARWRAALYVSVFVRVLLPAQWASPVGLLGGEAAATVQVVEPVVPAAVSSVAAAAMPVAPAPASSVPAGPVVYLAVLGILALAWGAARVLAARSIRSAREPGERVRAIAGSLPVVEHPLRGPAVYGLWRPRIVIPSALAARLDDESLSAVIEHEAAHVARRDPWRLAMLQLATFLAWPLVPAWIAAWRVRGLMEQACDEVVLKDAGPARRRAYGEALIAVADWQPLRARLALGMLPFGGGLAPRLRALRSTRRWGAAIQVCLVAVLGVGAVLGSGARETRAGEASASSDAAPGLPPLVVMRTEIFRGAPSGVGGARLVGAVAGDAPRTVSAGLAATLRTELATAATPVGDNASKAWLSGGTFTRMNFGPKDGPKDWPPPAVIYRLAPALRDGSLVVTISVPEKAPPAALNEIPVTLAPGEAVLLSATGPDMPWPVHVLLEPVNATWTADGPVFASPRVSLDLTDATVADALAAVQKVTGLPVPVEPESAAQARLSVSLADVPAEEAIAAIAEAAGLRAEMDAKKSMVVLRPAGAAEPRTAVVAARVLDVDESRFAGLGLRHARVAVEGPDGRQVATLVLEEGRTAFDFDAASSALEREGAATVVSRPVLMVNLGQRAEITSGSEGGPTLRLATTVRAGAKPGELAADVAVTHEGRGVKDARFVGMTPFFAAALPTTTPGRVLLVAIELRDGPL